MPSVRVRFAPSPTGFFHIGSARTALFNWLYARHSGGAFVLRIEDTDKERNTEESLQVLLNGMKWLGLDWDEGPDADGEFGPYFQSQRTAIYQEYLKKLQDAGRTYEKDGAIFFRLEGERYTEFDDYRKCEVEKVRAAPQVINDQVRGRVERAEEKDFVIFRSNGEPVFHFVNVVDDIAMGITHVIRGEDHLSNTSKHCELFRAFGVEPPVFAHIPLILKSSGPGKMSKRDEGALIEDYEKSCYLPAAVRNYLCLLGWSPKDDQEIMTIDEIIDRFDFDGINQGNARFDEKKMAHINAEYIRQLPLETLAWMVSPILVREGLIDTSTDEDYIQDVLRVSQEKMTALNALPSLIGCFFTDDYSLDEKTQARIFKKGDPVARVREFLAEMDSMNDFSSESIDAYCEAL
ncbi:MAG: glutamate--tRNA ligase family protein, partial [Opitutales bacterium]|nr:glutamate--tRNA ligase family protein [Opitutales bacterium]